ncbi:DUF5011 domain-containing protein, partial [Paenibacillus sepulcri]|nr:DUF5011 domain-containing protein [Paenibacillus sepulcri]
MKKSMTLFLIAVITALPLIGLWPVQAQAAYSFSDGDGSPGDPYIIKTAEDLDHIRDDLTSNYTLYGDIDLSSYGSWQPIGSGPSDMFTGNFDGMGNTITGLTIHSSDNFIGLFGYVGGAATFKNVRLENVDITSSNANAQIGGLASLTVSYQNTIDRCSVTGNIEGVGFTAGGLLGQLSQGTLTNSDAHVHLELDSTNNSFAGGIVGAFQSGKMENNLATGDVSGKGYAGGLVGYQQSGDMINSYATGNVTGASTSTIGGLLGYWTNGDIKNSYSAGIVGPAGVAGGLVGKEDNTFGIGPIINSYWNLSDNPTLQTIGSEIEMDGAVTSDAMKHWATYTGWDPLVWGIQEGKTSPYLLSFSPALRVDPLPSSVVYSTEPGSNQFALSGYMRDGSIGEIFEVGYFIEDALNTTVAQDVYATDSTGDNQRFQFPVTLDESSYTAGTYTIHVTINDTVSGHASQQSLTFNVIDITAPAAPVFTSPVNGQTANDATPTFSGTAEPGSTVTIVLDGASVGTTTAAGDGSWTWTTAPTLAEGAHTASIRATDAAGNTGTDSNVIAFTVDMTAPVITLLGDSAIALFEGDAFVDPGAAADDNFDRDLSDRITVTGTVYNQIPGTYTLRYNAQDIAGNAAAEVTR